VVDELDPIKRGKLMFGNMQSERNVLPIMSLIAKENKSAYNKFLPHIFQFRQELWDVGVTELGWKPFRVSEPQDMNIRQLCMNRGGATQQIPYVFHLFQKYSDGIVHPNQMPCGMCTRICVK
jgi:hypothetical protein